MNTKLNIADIQALIELYILNNKSGLINAMNSSGYPVAQNISDADLFYAVGKVGDDKGLKALQDILVQVPFDTSKLTAQEAKNLAIKYGNVDPNAKLSDYFKDLGTKIGDFFSGHTVVNQNPNVITQNSEPVLSPLAILSVAIIGIVSIIFINRGESSKGKTTITWVIGIIILAVAGYGILAKKQTIVQSGGGGSSDVHNGALSWLKGILAGLHLSVAG